MSHRPTKMPYSAYAAIYERIDQGAFAVGMAARTLDWMAPAADQRLRVLDLACGTGAAALVFAQAGHHVVGVDRAAAMLDLAEQKAQRAGYQIDFVAQDLRSLDLAALGGPASFDLVTCFFDSLNYLTGDRDLGRVCACVGEVLRPEGLFIFDLHTVYELASWEERDEVIYDDDDLLVYNRLSYNEDRQRATGRVVWFEQRDSRWWRNEETHIERPWSDAVIRETLNAHGMRLLAALTPDGVPATDQTPRVVYYAKRDA